MITHHWQAESCNHIEQAVWRYAAAAASTVIIAFRIIAGLTFKVPRENPSRF